MLINHIRFQTKDDHTKSNFLIDGRCECFILEDGFNEVKVYGETRISPGKRKIELRTEGGMHEKYLKKFGVDFHKGMLWIKDVDNFEFIYIHIGNTKKDTFGCLLTGFSADINKPMIGNSVIAYKKIYPIIRDAILSGEDVWIETVSIDQLIC